MQTKDDKVPKAQYRACEWWQGRTGAGVRIAIIDSVGMSMSEAHAHDTEVASEECAESAAEAEARTSVRGHEHGLVCATLMRELAPDAEMIPIAVLGRDLRGTVGDVMRAIEHARSLHVDIINLSVAMAMSPHARDLYDVCARALADGIVINAAAGDGMRDLPGRFAGVLATRAVRLPSLYQYYFDDADAIQCATNGAVHNVTWQNGVTVSALSPSFATARMSGLIALMLEKRPRRSPKYLYQLLEARCTQPPY